jgi:esterase
MKLFYRALGEGDPLIILHGLFGSSDNWQTLAKKFASALKVYTIDLRNHGRSFHHNEFNYEVMMNDILDFVDDHHLDRFSLMGHSMGGKLSMKFALNFPERVQNLIVIDIAPRQYQILHDMIIQALKALDLARYHKRDEVDEALGEMIQNFPIRQFLLKNLKRDGEDSFKWKINLDVIDRNIHNLVVEIYSNEPFRGKTLFIAGEKSDYIRPVDEELILDLFPAAKIKYFPGAGHWLHAQVPDLLYHTVMDFINS